MSEWWTIWQLHNSSLSWYNSGYLWMPAIHAETVRVRWGSEWLLFILKPNNFLSIFSHHFVPMRVYCVSRIRTYPIPIVYHLVRVSLLLAFPSQRHKKSWRIFFPWLLHLTINTRELHSFRIQVYFLYFHQRVRQFLGQYI